MKSETQMTQGAKRHEKAAHPKDRQYSRQRQRCTAGFRLSWLVGFLVGLASPIKVSGSFFLWVIL